MKSKTQSYIDAVTEYLARPRKVTDMSRPLRYNIPDDDVFRLEGHRFSVMEAEFSDVMTFRKTRMISVKPAEFPDMDALSIVYETADFWGSKGDRITREDMMTRVESCMKLAERFVREMLPKVDYRFKIELHNDEIENILEILK